MDVTITIPDPLVPRVIGALIGLNPVPLASDGSPKYSNAYWAKEQVRRFLINAVYSYERLMLVQAGRDAVRAIGRDDDLASVPGQDPVPEADTE